MAEELDKLLTEPTEIEGRIKSLSKKTSEAQAERDTERAEKEKAISERETAEKKASFYKDFSKISAKYSAAPEHMDEIEAKVLSGYEAEDATVSVLMKAGKFTPIASKPVDRQTVAGGSATTTFNQGNGSKSAAEMQQSERRQALLDAERNGDFFVQ